MTTAETSGRYDYLPATGWVIAFIVVCFVLAFVFMERGRK
jgi:hypothetical protein